MEMGAELTVMVGVGALFLVAPLAGSRVGIAPSMAVRIVCAMTAASYGFAAYGLADEYPSRYQRVALLLCALLPLLLAALVTREALGISARLRRPRADASPQSTHLLAHASDTSSPPELLARLAFAHPELRVAVAKNPATPASVLQWLSALGDLEVTLAICARDAGAARAVVIARSSAA